MKKVAELAAGVLLGLSMVAGVAAADTTCNGSISNTGPNSSNSVTCTDNNNNNVSCVNNVVVSDTNNQSAISGGAFTVGNTSAGTATSGNASNSNATVVNVGASCTPITTATTPTTTPTTPAPQVLGEQVTVKPTGAVHAGGGAGVQKHTGMLITGSIASLVTVAAGIGLSLRKRAAAL